MKPKIILAHTYYPEFLRRFYASDRRLAGLSFAEQRRRLLSARFSVSDAYSEGLRAAGWEAHDIVLNADEMQRSWADARRLQCPSNIHDFRRKVLADQVRELAPDVLYVFEWTPLGDDFLSDIKADVRLLCGQIASPLRADRSYRAYGLMISSWPPIVDHFRREGMHAEALRLGFDARVLEGLGAVSPAYDVTFVGGFAPSHPDRVAWLAQLLAEVPVEVFGYGIETIPAQSPVREHHHGEVWGWDMYRALAGSRVTLNRHAHNDVRGRIDTSFANNMRMYEATGVGSCLITEARANLGGIFSPDREVATYASDEECVEKVRYLLANDDERAAIARAGQARTLREHTYARRMGELSEILQRYL